MKRPFPEKPKGAPAGTIWFGGPIAWFSISLIIRADDLVPEDVTRILQVEPTHSQTKGQPWSTRAGAAIAKWSSWELSLKSAETDEWDVTEATRLLFDRLPKELSTWKLLPAGARIRMSFGLSLEDSNKGFSLPPDILRFAADRQIELDFDIYVETDAERDAH